MPSSSLRGASHKSTSRNMDHGQVGRSVPMFPFHWWSDSHVSIPPLIPVVTGASEGIGRGYALEVHHCVCCCVVSYTHDLRVASFPAGQARTECGHHESFSGQTAESGRRDQ